MIENRAQSTKESRPYFPGRAEAQQPLWSQLGGSEWSVWVCRWAVVLIVRCTSPWELHLRGQRRGGHQRLWAPADSAVLLPETRPWWAGCGVGTLGPLALGLSIPPPSLLGPPQKSPQAPGSPPLLSEPCIHSTCVRASFFFLSQTVEPKIANPRNHREADTDANTQGFIYKLELVSKYTRHSGAGTWTPRWVLA